MQPGNVVDSSNSDIHNLLSTGKSLKLDWYLEEVSLSRLASTLTGMANSAGGTVILGVTPSTAHIQGIHDVRATIDRVFQAALLVDPPLIIPIPQVETLGRKMVVVVQIPAGLPHVYSLEGRFLWREANRTNPIPARFLRQLLLERGIVQFENQVPPDADLEDLDDEKVAAYMKALGLAGEDSMIEVLLRRSCLRPVSELRDSRPNPENAGEKRYQPTYAALLLFSRHPQQWLPNATILATRFSGKTFSDRYVKQDISGSLSEQLQQADIFVRDNLRSTVRLIGLAHQESLEYPFEAVRELITNAVAHRDYNLQGDNIHIHIFVDRLEITSPGGLPGPVTIENLLDARYSRNAVIVQVLSDLGYIERLGYGLDRVVALMDQHGLPRPHFEETAGSFKVTLFNEPAQVIPGFDRTPYRNLNLNTRQETALDYLSTRERITSSDYQGLCPEVHPETLRRDLADLVSRGILVKIGDRRATYYILK
jgi:ATP-dependent DNA helicase RecG